MIRFLADASLQHHIVSGCLRREPALDFKPAVVAGLEGLSDLRVLDLAAQENRILVTQDIRTMPENFAQFLEAGNRSPGVLMISQNVPTKEAIDTLVLIWAASEPEEWTNRIAVLPFREAAGSLRS